MGSGRDIYLPRREFVKAGAGLAAILASGEAPAYLVRSLIGARSTVCASWSNPYVTDGLIAMWDGEWNAGGGVHDASATVWRDLTGNNDFSDFTSDVSWGPNFFVAPSRRQCATASIYDNNRIMTMECGVSLTGWNGLVLAQFSSNTGNPGRWFGFRANGTFNFANSSTCANGDFTTNTVSTFSGAFNTDWTLYKNGVDVPSLGNGMYWGDYTNGKSSINTVASAHSSSRIYFMRLYSRALTAEEIAANYSVDKERFGLP